MEPIFSILRRRRSSQRFEIFFSAIVFSAIDRCLEHPQMDSSMSGKNHYLVRSVYPQRGSGEGFPGISESSIARFTRLAGEGRASGSKR
jgi:hypothetical protein